MIKNYFTVAFRTFSRNRYHFLLNVTGLVLGISCFASLALFVHHELTFDKFYKDSENIYRITTYFKSGEQEVRWAITNGGLVPMLKEKISGVKDAAKILAVQSPSTFRIGDQSFHIPERTAFFSDENIFNVLDFKILAGDSAMLAEPNCLVLTESFAKKLFGSTDVLGKTIISEERGEDDTYKVTGVLADLPQNSHIQFDFLVSGRTSSSWKTQYEDKKNGGWPVHVYFKVFPGTDEADLADRIAAQVKSEYEPAGGRVMQYPIQRLRDIYFNSNNLFEHAKKGNINFIKILSIVALFVIIISIINYVLLSTSQSLQRAKEIGIRKALGSSRRKLFTQFLAEAVIVSGIAGLIAMLVIELILQFAFPSWFGIKLSLWNEPLNLVLLLALSIFIGLLAGLFPAVKITTFNTIQTLKGKLRPQGSKINIRAILVTSQFVFTVAILVGSIVVLRQLFYLKNMNPGFEKELVINISRPADGTTSIWNGFKEAVKKESVVKNAGISLYKFISDYNATGVRVLKADGDTAMLRVQWNMIDYNTLPTLGIKVLEGRNYSPEFATDTTALIMNMAAKKALGIDNLLDHEVLNWRTKKGKIIGIIEDYHFQTYDKEVIPIVLFLTTGSWESNLMVKINTKDYQHALEILEKRWKESGTASPFQYTFLDEWVAALTKKETQLSSMVSMFTVVSIVITVLGLLGLISYIMEQRKKEVGIRKVLGASVKDILVMVNKNYIGYILIAFVIAIPVSLYGIQKWLENFAYRITISPSDYIYTALIILVVATLTISLQSLRAAAANPANTLKEE